MREEISLTDEQIDAVWDDQFNITQYMEFESSFTRDTLEQFLEARKNWHEQGDIWQGVTDIGAHPFIEVERCQALKGKPRKTVRVIDFGTIRAIHES